MQAFTTSYNDPLTAAAAAVLFNEDLTTVKNKIKDLKIGDVTNFGTVKNISDTAIEFKARDTGVTKIAFNQRKMGSKDFVLDKLMKLKEEVDLDEGINFAAVAAAKKAGMSDAAIDSYVKIHKANGATDKEISAGLMSGKAAKDWKNRKGN